jgi:hypothetical protein
MMTLQALRSFYTTLTALNKPAKVTIAVPCWSSWKMGSFFKLFSSVSIAKHYGALISYKLIASNPPNSLIIAWTS